jgi:hypothetical protein
MDLILRPSPELNLNRRETLRAHHYRYPRIRRSEEAHQDFCVYIRSRPKTNTTVRICSDVTNIDALVRIISAVPEKGHMRLGVKAELDLEDDDKLSGP